MRKEVESHGPIRYVINTEHHVDHIFGNHFFRGAGTVVNHKGVYDNFMVVFPELDPFEYACEAIPTDDPEGLTLVPERDAYYADLNKGTVVFTGNLSLRVGEHDFHLLHTPGHTPGQIAVYVPQERMVFTGPTMCTRANRSSVRDSLPALVGSLVAFASALFPLVVAVVTVPVRLVRP
jgi:cyclase